ncbi:hypothetical protein ABMY26_00690 (plasmid) [Azospirillum sp. HJ39]|uniref:hypothetical protein n=1 Tax=Azospirillum sp. HJ39 TaxID=3159496 RepID=UPI003558A389
MNIGKALDIEAAAAASQGAHIELFRAAVLTGNDEQIRRAKLNCEAALEARLDATEAVVRAQREHRRRLGL